MMTCDYQTFAEWCQNINKLTQESRHTVSVVLNFVGESDCSLAQDKLATLEELDLSQKKIKDVNPLGCLKNLNNLNLAGNEIADIGLISHLNHLTEINLSGNEVVDLSPLSSLDRLESLWLLGNEISDLTPLENQNNITYIGLSANQIEDVTALGKLKKISYLGLSENKISDVTPLANLEQLNFLWLQDNEIKDVTPLRNLNQLMEIWLDNNPLDDLSPLGEIKSLDRVHWSGVFLTKKYYSVPFKDWQPEWLLTEKNVELKRILVNTIGYEKIVRELKTAELDAWREYTLLKIPQPGDEDILLLKMICPSTDHLHVLRVPPDISLAREAVRWVNWGIDPEEFILET